MVTWKTFYLRTQGPARRCSLRSIDIDFLATKRNDEEARSLVKFRKELMACIASKGKTLR